MRLYGYLGTLLFAVGGISADSDNLIIPFLMAAAGLLLLSLAYEK